MSTGYVKFCSYADADKFKMLQYVLNDLKQENRAVAGKPRDAAVNFKLFSRNTDN